MLPRSKRQVRVCELAKGLRDLSELGSFRKWAFDKCIDHIAYRTRMWTNCLSCGHVWPTESMTHKKETCPGCKRKVTVDTTRKKKNHQFARFAYLERVEEFQVIRYFEVNSRQRAAEEPSFYVTELMQHWIIDNKNFEIISQVVGGMGLAYDHFHGSLSLRNKKDLWKYSSRVVRIHPNSDIDPLAVRNGFTKKLQNIEPASLFKCLTYRDMYNSNRLETLVKAGQMSLVNAEMSESSYSYRYWPSIKIAIRNNYLVKDARTWFDYLSQLEQLGKDLHNAKYVCPRDLHNEHNRLTKKIRELDRKRNLERKRKELAHDEAEYKKSKSRFFGIAFSDGELEIKVLESVQEFIEEAEAHKHCVYSNSYYRKDHSLILSAKINGQPVETIEISLSEFSIVQSRGLANKDTEYHKRIIDLVNKNMQVIIDRVNKINKEAA